MEIDAAVESVRLVVATHLVASVVAGRPDPASWLPVPQAPAETSTLGPGAIPRSRFTCDRLRPVTIEAIRRIPLLHPTGPAVSIGVELLLTSPGRRVSWEVGLSLRRT